MPRHSGVGWTGPPDASQQNATLFLQRYLWCLANRYDWRLFLEVTGPGGSGSIRGKLRPCLLEDNATSATIETLESPRERATDKFSLIRLPDQEKWSGDGAGRA